MNAIAMAALGAVQISATPASPFAIRTVAATATPASPGVVVEIRSPDEDDTAEILRRAEALAPRCRISHRRP